MSTTVHDDVTEQRYELLLDGEVAGTADYELDAGRITITHTEVDDAYGGRGLGRELVTGALADAEARGLEVVPRCPYVRKVITEHAPRYLHLVPDELREPLGLAEPSA